MVHDRIFLFLKMLPVTFRIQECVPGLTCYRKTRSGFKKDLKKIHLSEKTRGTDPRYICKKRQGSTLIIRTPLSSQVGNLVLIDAFNVSSRALSMVFFLRASCCFPAEKKTRSIPPPDAGQPWNCLYILTTSGYVWLT